MGWQAWYTLGVVTLIFAFLIFTKLGADVVLIGGVALLMVVGVITPDQALGGLANEGMVTVGVMYIVGAGLRQTGGVDWIAQKLFGRPQSTRGAITRMMGPTMVLSAFMNNTPLVAMLIPAVNDWAKQRRVSPSKLMIPLSFAAMLGGVCTLIGTSTNLVVNGLVKKEAQKDFDAYLKQNLKSDLSETEKEEKTAELRQEFEKESGLPIAGLGMFEITKIGVPVAIVGAAFIILTAPFLLPDRKPALSQLGDPREYSAEMLVAPDSPLVGKTIEEAGLRHLPGVFLAEIDREGNVLPAVSPEEKLEANDRLVFVGIVESVVELQKMRGLLPAGDQVFKLTGPRSRRCLIEAVVSHTCPAVGKTIRDTRFRSTYNAVVIAVSRNGARLKQKIGDIELHAGDTLLLESHRGFVEQHKNNRDFLLVSELEGASPPLHERSLVAVGILMTMVTVVTIGWMSMLMASMLAAGMVIFTRCCSISAARKSVDWEVLLSIAASFAIGEALQSSGAAKVIAQTFIDMAQGDSWLALAAIYFVSVIATELLSNNSAAALMFPLGIATAKNLNVDAMPFVIAIMVAASSSFATPIGYQTNLMVQGPGGYRFSDFMRIGVPLDLVVMAVVLGLSRIFWTF